MITIIISIEYSRKLLQDFFFNFQIFFSPTDKCYDRADLRSQGCTNRGKSKGADPISKDVSKYYGVSCRSPISAVDNRKDIDSSAFHLRTCRQTIEDNWLTVCDEHHCTIDTYTLGVCERASVTIGKRAGRLKQ